MIDITRSVETPPSLERQTDDCLRAADVLEALHADFAGKCYLCERCYELPVYEVDHRRPQTAFPEHRFSWANLFPICEACNKRRPKAWPAGGMLSPGHFQQLEARLVQRLDYGPDDALEPAFAPDDGADDEAINTAAELTRIHDNKTDRQSASAAIKGQDLRSAIHRALCAALDLACNYQRLLRTAPNSPQRAFTEQALRRRLSRRAPYTALLRSRFADLPAIAALFD
ncbi:MAG: hypothetical protein H6703_15995 [Myxococcales bacterium]|nr:hypothetical protein [Myxococcales bacterium]